MASREIRFIAAAPNGRIDADTSPAFRTALDTKLKRANPNGAFDFVIDLSGISYMSSVGIRELLRIQKQTQKRGGRVILDMANDQIEEKIRLTGLERLLPEKTP